MNNSIAISGISGYRMRNTLALLVASLCLIGVAPLFVYPILLMKIACFVLFASAYNLLFGYVGLLAFGHAAFFGAGAYATGYAAMALGVTPEVAIIIGTAAAGALGALFGWLAIRRQGLYFAMITLALAQIVFFYAVQSSWTGGEDGLRPIPRGHLFGVIDLQNTVYLYIFVMSVVVAGLLFLRRIVHSPYGLALRAIRDNELRGTSLGFKVVHYKLTAFVISAMLSGVAGGLKAIVFQIASLDDLNFHVSGDVLLMVLIGGIGTFYGPMVGAIILVSLQYYLAPFGPWILFIQGVAFVVLVLVFRKGIIGAALDTRIARNFISKFM